MNIQQLIDSGQLDDKISTQVLIDLVTVLDFDLLDLRGRQGHGGRDTVEQAKIDQRQALIEQALSMLSARYGVDGMTLLDKGKADFKIMRMCGHQVLLERIDEEDGWQVIVSAFIDTKTRYDEWHTLQSIEETWQFIDTYSLDEVRAFINRARQWWEAEMIRKASPFMPQSLN